MASIRGILNIQSLNELTSENRKRPVLESRVGPSLINSCVIETICEAEVEPWIVWCRYLLRIIYRPGHRL
jgi:hypothetical protein